MFWIFLSVVVIEGIILVPSYHMRRTQLLHQLLEISKARVSLLMKMVDPEASDQTVLYRMTNLLDDQTVVGVVLLSGGGEIIGFHGEKPEYTSYQGKDPEGFMQLSRDGTRYEAGCAGNTRASNYTLVLRHDATSVKIELRAYVNRIAWLVLIISLVVTTGAWLALGPIVVTPIIRLRDDLVRAGEAIENDEKTPRFHAAGVDRKDELGEVITAFNQMYLRIRAAISERKRAEFDLQTSLEKVEAYSNALKEELEKGRKMQNNFLPCDLINKPGWKIEAFFKPARQVAGDFYDVFDLPGNKLGIVVADVCDKGVGAALFMALFRSLIRIFSGQPMLNGLDCRLISNGSGDTDGACDINPLQAVRYTNDYIAKNHGELAMFATLFFGVLDLTEGRLSYINGGHDPLFVLSRAGAIKTQLSHTGPAVGIAEGSEFIVGHTRLGPGDIFFGYTDGVFEARNTDDQLFSKERLLSLFPGDAVSAATLIQRIKHQVSHHTGSADQFDDITMVALQRDGNQYISEH